MSVGVGTAIIGGAVIGGGLGLVGGAMQAGAAENAASNQYNLGLQQLQFQKDTQTKALSLAMPSAAELAQQDQLYQVQFTALQNQITQLDADRSLLNSVDPAIKSAGEQAYKILNGQNSELLNPVLAQRDRQRTQLEQSLRDRMGPGYAESSAGAAALRQFDQDTQLTTAQIQQQSLGTLLGTAQFGASLGRNDALAGFNQLGNLSSLGLNSTAGDINRQVNALTGNPVSGYTPLMESAGNQGVGSQVLGQTIGNFGSAIAGAGATLGGSLLSKPSQPPNYTLPYAANMGAMGSEAGSSFGSASGFGASGQTLAQMMNGYK